jgi:hypothetical protein
MGYEISASQLTELVKEGFVVFKDFITKNDMEILENSKVERDSFQKCPLTKKILLNRDLGKLIFEIIGKRPIRLVMSKKIFSMDSIFIKNISIEEIYIGVFFSFEDLTATFFLPFVEMEMPCSGFLALYGDSRARYIQKEEDIEKHYLLSKGFASGDKLDSARFPLIFK